MLNHDDLLKLAEWKPISPGFGRNGENAYEVKVKPVFHEIEKLEKGEVRVITDGGLSNYASAFVHNRRGDSGNIEGLYIYLSLLAPLAAIGRETAYVTDKARAYSMIEPSDVLELNNLRTEFEKSVGDLIEAKGFKILSPSEATTKLPSGVVPYEYCLNNEPWDRLFHVLFSDTD
ncbi:hypothetical protein EDC30_1231 [Paucimonas lemoignei]|uniref:Uncharacterized protein n=1 Tax=Paucimonas lemoignei TaxID=29443 RepID=A0A4R3HP72_PAULE|nr:hypothetical protein [Paucimonas lemoignei]TCS32437.1 hypothetical protein EDC30_1231 [Paucimonas lemoignei]